jgi:hypothetical protein
MNRLFGRERFGRLQERYPNEAARGFIVIGTIFAFIGRTVPVPNPGTGIASDVREAWNGNTTGRAVCAEAS